MLCLLGAVFVCVTVLEIKKIVKGENDFYINKKEKMQQDKFTVLETVRTLKGKNDEKE